MKYLGLFLVALAASACGDKAAPSGVAPAPSAGPAEVIADPDPRMAVVTSPGPDARAPSPLLVEGSAPGPWFFEAVLPVTLVVNGEVVAEAPGEAQADWMTVERVPFRSELTFAVDVETPAELVVAQDMPGFDDNGDELPPLEVRIPVVLTPAGAP